ncbi:unnamed protein product [Acanthoscelides obtectus]|uniref:Uncharacterized protein n=1 Tax=Acanthoscelides obtectus TaxID=200917 RepID=A0A9P0P6C6_ACAOB|nr:unnamed protein product [Acanthoscelides obtectus]CAK1629370.1 hypothetical protein AOBTE_LOCUS5705 [Acanthoscelides obtectus]
MRAALFAPERRIERECMTCSSIPISLRQIAAATYLCNQKNVKQNIIQTVVTVPQVMQTIVVNCLRSMNKFSV